MLNHDEIEILPVPAREGASGARGYEVRLECLNAASQHDVPIG